MRFLLCRSMSYNCLIVHQLHNRNAFYFFSRYLEMTEVPFSQLTEQRSKFMDQIFSVSLFFKIIYFIGLVCLKGEGLT